MSRGAWLALERFGAFSIDDEPRDRTNKILTAARAAIVRLEQQVNFLAEAVVAGVPCVLLCGTVDAGPRSDRAYSTQIRNAFHPDDAEALLRQGRGVLPFFGRF